MTHLDTSDIDIWPKEVFAAYVSLSEALSPQNLNDSERKEYEGFTHKKRKAEYLAGRSLFRYLLPSLDLDPHDTQLLKEEDGKPYAISSGEHIHVSFSHSREAVFCAVSRSLNIGLDAEHAGRVVKRAVLDRILNEEEKKTLDGIHSLKWWTIKESAVKCHGTGLRTNLNDLTIEEREEKRFFVRFNNDLKYEICSFHRLDHQIALAYQSEQT